MPGVEQSGFSTVLRANWLRAAAAIALLGGLFLAGRLLPVRSGLVAFLEWAEDLGFWGALTVGAVYLIACVLMVPGSIITVGAGALFGLFWGTLTASVGSTLGACAAFLAGRTIARGWVQKRMAGYPRFRAIDDAVGTQGLRVVLLLRLSPMFPFNLLNYGLGLTGVPFWKYAAGSWLGMLPGTIMYVYIGTVVRSLTAVAAGTREATMAERVFFWAGLGVTIGAAFFVTRLARRALRDMADTQAETGGKENL